MGAPAITLPWKGRHRHCHHRPRPARLARCEVPRAVTRTPVFVCKTATIFRTRALRPTASPIRRYDVIKNDENRSANDAARFRPRAAESAFNSWMRFALLRSSVRTIQSILASAARSQTGISAICARVPAGTRAAIRPHFGKLSEKFATSTKSHQMHGSCASRALEQGPDLAHVRHALLAGFEQISEGRLKAGHFGAVLRRCSPARLHHRLPRRPRLAGLAVHILHMHQLR